MTISAQHRLFAGVVALLALTAAVFEPVLTFDFVRWDDDINITQNPLLTEPWTGSLAARFFSADHALRFKPLHWLFARGIHAAAGFSPAPWHAASLVLHLLATGLFFLVLREVLRLPRVAVGVTATQADLAALLGAAVWSVHPLRAEAVGWVTASTYPLSAVMLLGSFFCYLRAQAAALPSHGWLVSAWILAVMGYASYPVTATYGLWLIVVDTWLLRPPVDLRAAEGTRTALNWTKHAVFLAPAVLAIGFTMWSRYSTPGIFTPAPSVESVGVGTRAIMALASLSYLAGRLAWPVDLTPNVPPLAGGGPGPAAIGLALTAIAALLLAWRARHTRPLLTVWWLGFAALSVPCLGLTERPTWPVDRYSYIAHLPLIGGIVLGLARTPFAAARGTIAVAVAGSVAAVLALAARAQTMIWSDTGTLFTHMEQHPDFEDNPRQQGHIYVLWGHHEAANARRDRAAERFARAHEVYLAAMRGAVGRGDYQEALSLLTHVERHFGLTPILRRERAAWLLREGRVGEAVRELRELVALLPDDGRLHSLLAEAKALAEQPRPPATPVAPP